MQWDWLVVEEMIPKYNSEDWAASRPPDQIPAKHTIHLYGAFDMVNAMEAALHTDRGGAVHGIIKAAYSKNSSKHKPKSSAKYVPMLQLMPPQPGVNLPRTPGARQIATDQRAVIRHLTNTTMMIDLGSKPVCTMQHHQHSIGEREYYDCHRPFAMM